MNNFVLAIGALIVSLGIFFGYVRPVWSGPIAETKAAIVADDKALEAAAVFAVHEKQLADARDVMSAPNLARLTAMLPDSVNTIGLILDFNALAAQSGISITEIVVSSVANTSSAEDTGVVPVETASPEQSIDFTLKAIGGYSGFKTFLTGVEKSERLLDIQELAVKGSDTGVYTYTMRIRVYWLR